MDWMEVVSAALGFMEANDKSGSTMRPKDQWYLNNPTSSSPFYNQDSSWNKGNPTLDRQMTPELQQVFDEVIWGALAQGREPYGMSDNMGRLQNLQQNNQLGRYGQRGDPYTGKPNAGGRNAYAPVGSNSYGNRSVDPKSHHGTSASQPDYMDELQRALMGGNPRGGGSSHNNVTNPNSGGSVGWDGNWNAGQIAGQFEDGHGNTMYNDVVEFDQGGREFSWIADNADQLGAAFSIATGIPFGGIGGQAFQDWVYDNYTFQNSVNPEDPYGLGNYPIDPYGNGLPHSGMNDGDTTGGNSGGYGGNSGNPPSGSSGGAWWDDGSNSWWTDERDHDDPLMSPWSIGWHPPLVLPDGG